MLQSSLECGFNFLWISYKWKPQGIWQGYIASSIERTYTISIKLLKVVMGWIFCAKTDVEKLSRESCCLESGYIGGCQDLAWNASVNWVLWIIKLRVKNHKGGIDIEEPRVYSHDSNWPSSYHDICAHSTVPEWPRRYHGLPFSPPSIVPHIWSDSCTHACPCLEHPLLCIIEGLTQEHFKRWKLDTADRVFKFWGFNNSAREAFGHDRSRS